MAQRSRITTALLLTLFVTSGCCILLSLRATPSATAESSNSAISNELDECVSRLVQNPALISSSSLSSELAQKEKALFAGFDPYYPSSFEKISNHFSSAAKALAAEYPAGTISFNQFDVLKSFSGTKDVRVLGMLSPLSPINAYQFRQETQLLEKLSIDCGGKSIPGLRLHTELHEDELRNATDWFELGYLDTLNARIFGYTHAQVILPLSTHTRIAESFYYNGQKPWSEHRRYRKEQQSEQPLLLTNFTHASGTRYLTSDHPDFSLAIEIGNERSPCITFFLWRNSALPRAIGQFVQAPKRLPDFVFQIRIRPSSPKK